MFSFSSCSNCFSLGFASKGTINGAKKYFTLAFLPVLLYQY